VATGCLLNVSDFGRMRRNPAIRLYEKGDRHLKNVLANIVTKKISFSTFKITCWRD
jgi:hypothetical protein